MNACPITVYSGFQLDEAHIRNPVSPKLPGFSVPDSDEKRYNIDQDLGISGILLPPTSLPSPFGIGDLGPQACGFIDFLAESGPKL